MFTCWVALQLWWRYNYSLLENKKCQCCQKNCNVPVPILLFLLYLNICHVPQKYAMLYMKSFTLNSIQNSFLIFVLFFSMQCRVHSNYLCTDHLECSISCSVEFWLRITCDIA